MVGVDLDCAGVEVVIEGINDTPLVAVDIDAGEGGLAIDVLQPTTSNKHSTRIIVFLICNKPKKRFGTGSMAIAKQCVYEFF